MKFKDVAHLYVGCKVQWMSDLVSKTKEFKPVISVFNMGNGWLVYQMDAKPILYPLSALTEGFYEELETMPPFLEETPSIYNFSHPQIMAYAARVKYLIDHHFDVFGLIETGEAIDVTSLEKNPY